MRKTLLLLVAGVMVLCSCAHGRVEKSGARTMYYAYHLEDVIAASKVVLKEQDYEIVEVNMTEKFIKAVKGALIPGMPITVQLSFRPEGENTWLEVTKRVPPQVVPGSTARHRMDIDDLFRHIELELDRNF